ncbi:MAG: hypothetical protein IKM41_02620 [Tidjanibacter sp.]|nr:hypothetical protein [Tidjanibacter sp.]
MKYFSSILKWSVAVVALALSACQTPEPDVVEPNFPTLIEANVVAGETFKFTINPNMDWKLNIPSEQFAYFKLLLDNGKEDLMQRGSAGTHEISVVVVDQTDFNKSQVCEISLTMGTRTEVVARLTKGKMERSAKVYTVRYNQSEEVFEQEEDGSWIYESEPTQQVAMIWDNSQSQWIHHIKVEANFKWTLRGAPEWMDSNDIYGGEAGSTHILLKVHNELWPLESGEYQMELCDISSDNNGDGTINTDDIVVVSQLTFSLEGCKDFMGWSLGEELKFNSEGLYYQPSSYSYSEEVLGVLVAPYGMKLYKLTYYNNRFWASDSVDYSEWANVVVGDYAEGANDKVGVWERTLTISAQPTTYATARECYIVALPANVADKVSSITQLVKSDNSAMVEEYEEYVLCRLVQAGTADEEQKAVAVENENAMMATGGLWEELTPGTAPWNGQWAEVPNGYRLTYKSNEAGSELLFADEFARYEIYGPKGQYDVENCWIGIAPCDRTSADGVLYRITMRLGSDSEEDKAAGLVPNSQPTADGGNEATFIFYNSAGTAFALVHCVLDPALDPYANLEAPIQFANPTEAFTAGATLERIQVGEDNYDSDTVSRGVALYRITCGPNYKEMELKVPSYSSIWDSYQQNKGYISATQVSSKRVRISINSQENIKGGRVTLYNGSTDVAQIVIYYNAN